MRLIKCLLVAATVCCFKPTHLSAAAVHSSENPIVISVDVRSPIRHLNDKFVSVALECLTVFLKQRADEFYSNYTKLLSLSKPLTPAYLRVGGSSCDSSIYVGDQTVSHDQPPKTLYFNQAHWDKLYQYVQDANFSLSFGVNVLPNNGSGYWDYGNFDALLKHTQMKHQRASFELGNEPNIMPHHRQRVITPGQLVADYAQLKSMVGQYDNRSFLLIGPSVTKPHIKDNSGPSYMQDFLLAGGARYLDVVSWHQYYLPGHGSTVDNLTEVRVMDILPQQIRIMADIVKQHAPRLTNHVWLGETSSVSGGGMLDVTDRFVAGFLWLDKLGVSASLGIEVVVRESLIGAHYSLLDKHLNPNPDYWLTVLYKVLVGQTVLNVTQQSSSNKKVRLYAHCSSSCTDSLTVYGLNVDSVSHSIHVSNTTVIFIETYILTSGGRSQTSNVTFLNGVALKLQSDGSLPPFVAQKTKTIELPPLSYGFFVLKLK